VKESKARHVASCLAVVLIAVAVAAFLLWYFVIRVGLHF